MYEEDRIILKSPLSLGACNIKNIANHTESQSFKHLVPHRTVFSHELPAVCAGEEDSLSFICRSHLSSVVHHPLFVATRAASVNLEGAGTLINSRVQLFPITKQLTEQYPVCSYHRSFQFRVLLLNSYWRLLHRIENYCRVDLLAAKLWTTKYFCVRDYQQKSAI